MCRYWIGMMVLFMSFMSYAIEFPAFREIGPNIQFWMRVYNEWTTQQIVFFDSEELNIVYCVRQIPSEYKTNPMPFIKQFKQQIKQALSELALRQPNSEKGLEGLVKELYLTLLPIQQPDKYNRTDLIRSQVGLRDRFELGLKLSGAHEQEIQARLLYKGLPKELIAIVFVESLFYPNAISNAGAAGLWQLLRGTAKETVKINQLVDERFDPVLSTESAIQYIQKAQQQWSSWPLTITSYNCGRSRIKHAIEQVGSKDYIEILKRYNHPRFGFAARNYYSEFLAALHTYEHAQTYFPQVEKNKPWKYVLYKIPKTLLAKDVFGNRFDLEQEFYLYNPAIKKEVKKGREVLPAGLIVRFAFQHKAEFEKRIAQIPTNRARQAERSLRAKHRVSYYRQTLRSIADAYDVVVQRLAQQMKLKPDSHLSKGKVVLVYSQDSRFSELPSPLSFVE